MNVQSTAALIQQLHGALPLSSETASGSPLRLELLVCVLLRRGRQTVVPGRTETQTLSTGAQHQSLSDLRALTICEKRSMPANIFIGGGGPPGHDQLF